MERPRILVAREVFPSVLERLGRHFEVQANADDRIYSAVELARQLAGRQGAFITPTEPLNAEVLAANPQLKIVASMGVGTNNIDIEACTAQGVLVTNAPDVLTETTADLGFALVLAAARRLAESEAWLRAGHWDKWRYDSFMGTDVHHSTLGILGMGRIGQAIARRGAHGFGMQVLYHNRRPLDPLTEAGCRARWVDFETLLRDSDHLVVMPPYSAATHHIVGARELALMRPGATLVNIGRGGLVDEDALADALEAGRLHAAGLDVFEGEPRVNPRLLALKNVVLTPHIGSASGPTRLAMADLAADNLVRFFAGQAPLTPVNPQVLAAA